jgi:hypothetical protein
MKTAMTFTWHLSPNTGWGTPRQIGWGTVLGTPRGPEDAPAFQVADWEREASSISDALSDADIPTKAQASEAMEALAAQGYGEMIVRAGKRVWFVRLRDRAEG